ncbi:MBL fold metallo-hydrolase [Flagellimonas aquimarina]|uniref:MBL fold metallo-hydrolase n=1 Tax=Flagellimonas aquimarina TaxID=2201895 RepID=A0A316L4R3_9FLAO|nr:MBL fold metallo-hydrolase [Allomuricauda koreensis]PWL39895.1 MBL fold metallo-hydrolase [Allomuricauda koreensis]
MNLKAISLLSIILLISCKSSSDNKAPQIINVQNQRSFNGHVDLNEQNWIHGSEDCDENIDPSIQVVQYDQNTWILRQNKCLNFEAPFMFLFLGEDKALLMDTGATKEEEDFPLQATVDQIVSNWEKQQNKSIELIVAHTHKHGDHYAADGQFQGKPKTTLVGLEKNDVIDFFMFANWPNDIVEFELGNRALKVIPIPGHQEASISVYDPSSKLLLTGDTFYPGRLYMKENNWSLFKESINRLVDFSKNNEIAYILGNHVEMSSKKGVSYPMGTTYQPEEHGLPLTKKDLLNLHSALIELGDNPTRGVYDNFVIYPH